jgi:phage protein U
MKLRKLLLIALSLTLTAGFAQVKTKTKTTTTKTKTVATKPATPKMGKNVTKVEIKGETYYMTKEIGYNVLGTYNYEGKGAPIVELNQDGTGLFALHEMSPTRMVWGFECEMDGTPKKNETPWGAVYRLWYQIKEKNKGASWESGVVDAWDIVQFSIHFDEHLMYILGERTKSY